MDKDRYLLVVSGPSGSGKDSVVGELRKLRPDIQVSISVTTREKRPGEAEGVDYYFVSKEQFKQYRADGVLLESTDYVGTDNYGTLRSEVDDRIDNNITCILVIDVKGAESIKRLYPNCTAVFIMAPTMEELERRLRNRDRDASEEQIQRRMARAKEECKEAKKFDYQLINDKLDQCAKKLKDILQKQQSS